MGLRDRIQERRDERREDKVHYRMRQKLVSIGDDFWIEDDRGQRVYKVNGKVLRVRDTTVFEDANGRELLKLQERVARVRDTVAIEDPDGNNVASVKKALISPLRDRWTVKIGDGPDLKVKGNIVDHEYTIENDSEKIAEISKRWFRVADTYGVEIDADVDPVVVLAITAVIDSMAHEDK